ncbi:probable Actin-related protein 2/3 complex subunit 5 [Zygosaccharomyces bailii ISA1307]|nr:probable Actin-related protein 2/3 complex subunit 5 [Zygosaccharomyces bailii ISA1307]
MEDWRRIDIDALDPESGRLTAQDLIPPYVTQTNPQEVQQQITQIKSFATSGDIGSALQVATNNPPYGADNSTKTMYFHALLETLTQVRQADIASVVKQLQPQQQDVLMKYLYKGMSAPEGQRQGGILLAWFEKLTQVAGVRPVMHYLTDRRTV